MVGESLQFALLLTGSGDGLPGIVYGSLIETTAQADLWPYRSLTLS